MNFIPPKDLINDIDTPEIKDDGLIGSNRNFLQNMAQAHRSIINQILCGNEEHKDNDISDIEGTKIPPERFIFKQQREYNEDFMDNLEQLEYIHREKQDLNEMLHSIDYIIKEYKNSLICGDYIDIILKKCFALHFLGKFIDSNVELHQISGYEKYFTDNQKIDFYATKGSNLFFLGEETQNRDVLTKALECFDKTLEYPNESNPLSPEVYKDIQYKRATIMIYLMKDEAAIPVYQEIIAMPAAGHPEDGYIRINSLYLLGTAFSSLGRYQEAIDSLREYLKYKPDDETTKKYIRSLSEQFPE